MTLIRTYLARTSLAALGLVTLAACGSTEPDDTPAVQAEPAEPTELIDSLKEVSAGTYSLEKTHAFLTFKVPHSMGLSDYRVSFTEFEAALSFDPANPEASSLTVSINPASVETNFTGDYAAGHEGSPYGSWNEDLSRNPDWLNSDIFSEITFVATDIERTGDTTGTVTGDLTFLGQTQSITLDVVYNGSGNAPWFGERDLIGFNAETSLKRSDWGMTAALPFVGDEVSISFSGEFLQDE